jgi:hypothetical protein
MLKLLKHGFPPKRRPDGISGKAEVLWEETDERTTRAAGVGVLARRERFAEITSGRGSGQQGRNPAGESPAVSIARVGHVAIPHLGAGNQPSYAWCKRPGCPVRVNRAAVGATGGSSKCGSLNVMEWLQPREPAGC